MEDRRPEESEGPYDDVEVIEEYDELEEIPETEDEPPKRNWKVAILCYLQLGMLAGILGLGYAVYSMDKNRAVVNMTVPQHHYHNTYKMVGKHAPIPKTFMYATARVKTDHGTASGTIIGPSHIVTNYHVVHHDGHEKHTTVWVEGTFGGKWQKALGTILTCDKKRDLAVIRISGSRKFDYVPLMAKKDPGWSRPVVMVGCPAGMMPLATRGEFGHRNKKNMQIICCNGFFGNSGGPVFNGDGHVIGIVHAMVSPVRKNYAFLPIEVRPAHIFFLIPFDWVQDHIEENKIKLTGPLEAE